MFLVAVTGGIASGKSTVCRMFADLGCPVIDADRIAREGACVPAPVQASCSRSSLKIGPAGPGHVKIAMASLPNVYDGRTY